MSRHYQSEYQKSIARKIGLNNRRHGMTGKRIYNIWHSMKARCENPNNIGHKYYHDRGITVCDEWKETLGFDRFLEWSMSNGYNDKLTIDRIDTNGGYSPNNCRWVDYNVQGNNKRNNRFFEYNGKTKTLLQWAEDPACAVTIITLAKRIYSYKWQFERAFLTPKLKRKMLLNKIEKQLRNDLIFH